MSRFILIDLQNANRILDWQDEAMFSYGYPGEGQSRIPISEKEWVKRDDAKVQGFYGGKVKDWLAPPESIPDGQLPEWNGSTWILVAAPPSPPPPVPTAITMRQARLVLLATGMYDMVSQVVAQLPRAAQIEWEFASVVERSNPLIALVQAQAGLTDAQIDDLFRQGATL